MTPSKFEYKFVDGAQVTGELAALNLDPNYKKRFIWILYQPKTPTVGGVTTLTLELRGKVVMTFPIYRQESANSAWGLGSSPRALLSASTYPSAASPAGLAVPQLFSIWVRFTNGSGGDIYQHFQVTPFILDLECDKIKCTTTIPAPLAADVTWLYLGCLSALDF